MKTFAEWIAICVTVPLFCGCGSGSGSSVTSKTPDPSTLAGNWLILGSMPSIFPAVSNQPAQHLQLALTVDVAGNSVTASGFGNHLCNGFAYPFNSASLMGTVAKDGSFSLSGPTTYDNVTVALTGNAPATGAAAWSGSNTASFGALTGSANCVETLSDTFTATFFPLISGVYTGTAVSVPRFVGGPAGAPLTLQMTLQQGATTTGLSGATVTNNTLLTGSIKVQGSPCFTSGTTNAGSVVGNEVSLGFSMNDGATLLLTGSLADGSESQITPTAIYIRGGLCGGTNILPEYMAELDRQS